MFIPRSFLKLNETNKTTKKNYFLSKKINIKFKSYLKKIHLIKFLRKKLKIDKISYPNQKET